MPTNKNNKKPPNRLANVFTSTRSYIGSFLSKNRDNDPKYSKIIVDCTGKGSLRTDKKCRPLGGGNKKTQRNKSNFRRNRYKNNRTRKVYKKRH
jgi:hypothetical protein